MRASNSAVERGIAFLASAQTPDGSFFTQLSSDRQFKTVEGEQLTTFTPALLLQVLTCVPGAEEVCRRLSQWLLRQQSPEGAFNYWPIAALERTTKPYPDDLDDTACALAALHLHDPGALDSAQLAKMVRLLITAEAEVGGPYRTWLVPSDASIEWQNVDVVVNSNIQYLLQLVAEPLPKLEALLAKAVAAEDFYSEYYPLPLTVCYFFARVCPSKSHYELVDFILRQQENGFWQSPLQTAWACTALCRLGSRQSQQKAIDYLLGQQLPDGSWPAECVWLDEKRGGERRYAGSVALSTAFALEALCMQAPPTKSLPKIDVFQPIFHGILTDAKREIDSWPSSLRPQANTMLQKLQQGETGQELVLLPQLFAESLAGLSAPSPKFLAGLSVANIFGWMAFTIYDDFLDGEGEIPFLPVANVAMRSSLHYFRQALPYDQMFQRQVLSIFQRIDAANAWEAAHCRFVADAQSIIVAPLPKYPSAAFLAERSIGHALTPLAVLAAAGISVDHPQAKLFLAGFRHYLAARQLNDDLHDWQEDVRQGRISYVVARLLRSVPLGRRSLAVLLPQLERYFWRDALQELCAETSGQLIFSRQKLTACEFLRPDSQIFTLNVKLEESIKRTLNEQKRALLFLEQFTK